MHLSIVYANDIAGVHFIFGSHQRFDRRRNRIRAIGLCTSNSRRNSAHPSQVSIFIPTVHLHHQFILLPCKCLLFSNSNRQKSKGMIIMWTAMLNYAPLTIMLWSWCRCTWHRCFTRYVQRANSYTWSSLPKAGTSVRLGLRWPLPAFNNFSIVCFVVRGYVHAFWVFGSWPTLTVACVFWVCFALTQALAWLLEWEQATSFACDKFCMFLCGYICLCLSWQFGIKSAQMAESKSRSTSHCGWLR